MNNVTRNPLSFAEGTADPAIEDVIDCGTGEVVHGASWIANHRYDEIVRRRQEIRESLGQSGPAFICAMCHRPVYLVSNQHKRFFFRHVVDANCAVTRGNLSQDEIRARKYHGQRESEAHRRLKSVLVRSLDGDDQFSETAEEKTWSSSRSEGYRRPDVQSVFRGLRIAFEIQLSTTFLDVVLARRRFYRDEGGLLVWMMGSFDPEFRRMTTDDMLVSNNANLLIVDDETVALSEAEKRFHVRCWYHRVFRDRQGLGGDWSTAIVPFDQLTLDTAEQVAFHYDHRAARADVLKELADELSAGERNLRQSFLERWAVRGHLYADRYEHDDEWHDLRRQLAAYGLDTDRKLDRKLTSMIDAILSVRDGAPVGWKFTKVVQVAHHIAERNPDLVAVLLAAIRVYGRDHLLDNEDQKGAWRRRRDNLRSQLADNDPKLTPNEPVLPYLSLLFPEVAELVLLYLNRNQPKPT